MRTVKTRKQGNAITVTVPKSLNIEAGKEYIVIKGEGDAFTYIPKEENIFDKAFEKDIDLRVEDDLESDIPVGREMI